jgi:hypothetical protein
MRYSTNIVLPEAVVDLQLPMQSMFDGHMAGDRKHVMANTHMTLFGSCELKIKYALLPDCVE